MKFSYLRCHVKFPELSERHATATILVYEHLSLQT